MSVVVGQSRVVCVACQGSWLSHPTLRSKTPWPSQKGRVRPAPLCAAWHTLCGAPR